MGAADTAPDHEFSLDDVTVDDCEPSQIAAFRDLNLAWIRRYFAVEAADRVLLDDPQTGILDQRGMILVANWAEAENRDACVIGCCALLRGEHDTVMELSKMAVDDRFLGKRVGHLIARAAIQRARQAGANKLRLETNSKLIPAVRLYEKLGFVALPARKSAYTRADVQMVIDL